jgi:hypothetical protein
LLAFARRALLRIEHAYLTLAAARLDEPTVLTHRSQRWFVAVPTDLQPAERLARDNLDLVLEVCARADCDPLVVPAADPQRSRVIIPETQRDRFVARLRADWKRRALYAGPPRGRAFLVSAPAPSSLDGMPELQVFRPRALRDGGPLVLGEAACDVVFAPQDHGWLHLGLDNRVTERLQREDLEPAELELWGGRYRSARPLVSRQLAGSIRFPIHAVYTWVDGDDPNWQRQRDRYLDEQTARNDEAVNRSRYENRDELRHSLRSLWANAGWIEHVWLVTDGQVPGWLVDDHPRLTVVDHKEVFHDPEALPTFNSHAIEAQLHHIDGLSEQFLYLNDDVFFGRWVPAELFFLPNGLPRFFPSRHQLDLGPASPSDPPVMSAGKNGRDLLAERFGVIVTQKLKHTPHALLRSTQSELEQVFSEEFHRTTHSRFRHHTDVSFASSLSHHYGFLSGRAVPADLDYDYLDLPSPKLVDSLRDLQRRRHLQTFCVNDTFGEPAMLERRGPAIQRFLERYFPTPSGFER